MHSESYTRRLPVGAEVQPGGGIHFRVWAPDWKQVDVWLEPFHTGSPEQPQCVPMTADSGGYFAAFVPQAKAGTPYRYRLGQENVYPDPASRRQPEGPHGPSQVVDPGAYAWRDGDWPGVTLAGQVIYELHVGTFTPEGTLRAAARAIAGTGRPGHYARRDHARGRVRRRASAGATTASICSPLHGFTACRTTSASSSTRPTPMAWECCWT